MADLIGDTVYARSCLCYGNASQVELNGISFENTRTAFARGYCSLEYDDIILIRTAYYNDDHRYCCTG
jgi:hypothetical protein